MTDRRASFEGPHHSRQAPDFLSDPGQQDPISASLRRRPVRIKPASDVFSSSSPAWVETDKGNSSHDVKAGRPTPRRLSRTSTQSDLDSNFTAGAPKGTASFFPKLGRILEGSESRRHSSIAGSEQQQHQAPRRRRPAENATLSRRPVRQKHGSLQRRAEGLANLSNPSLISVLSAITQHSNVSSESTESNETITQQSYNRALSAKYKLARKKKRPQGKRGLRQAGQGTMEAQQEGVFRYMNESSSPGQFHNGEGYGPRPSTASSSSTTSHHSNGDDASSDEEKNKPVVDSPMTSPASTRKPHEDLGDDDGDSNSGLSVRESSPMSHRQPSVSDDVEGSDEEDGGTHHEPEEGSDSSEYSENEGSDNASATDEVAHQQQQAQQMALERVPPPRLPSASSSRHSDKHTRRLRRQEQALNEHVLQAPQPQRHPQFVGGPSPQSFPPHPAMPIYDPYMQSGASPAAFHAAQPALPPAPPPPPQAGYYSPPRAPPMPFSPRYENNLTMAPVGAPSAMVPAPLPHYPVQPPQYQPQPQPQPTASHLTRTTVIGYELVADKLSEGSKSEHRRSHGDAIVPMYRKFEQLNHRVLLHLQDEISELEEELRQLDECIAQYSPRDGAGLVQPASRRADARFGGELHSRRTELLGRIYVKLGQYNSAFTSFNTMTKEVETAQPKDIQAYRTWLEQRTPIEYAETRFLQHKSDLMAVSRKSANTGGGVSAQQSAAIFLPLILVLPLMAFAIVPGLLGRLFVLVAIGAGIIRIVMSTKELLELMTPREWTGCVSVYFGFMAVLAALVH